MKKIKNIILIISLTGFLVLQIMNANGPTDTIVSIINNKHQHIFEKITKQYLSRGAIRLDKLNYLFIKKDFFKALARNPEFQSQSRRYHNTVHMDLSIHFGSRR